MKSLENAKHDKKWTFKIISLFDFWSSHDS